METKKQSFGKAWKGLLVVAIIAAVIAVTIFKDVLHNARETVNQRQCLNNLKELWSASMMYAQDHDGWMPIYINDSYPDDGHSSNLRVRGFSSPEKLRLSLDKYVRKESAWFCPSAMSASKYYEGTCDYRYSTYSFLFRVPGVLRADRLVKAPQRIKDLGLDHPSKVAIIGDDIEYLLPESGEYGGPHRAGSPNAIFLDGHAEILRSE